MKIRKRKPWRDSLLTKIDLSCLTQEEIERLASRELMYLECMGVRQVDLEIFKKLGLYEKYKKYEELRSEFGTLWLQIYNITYKNK